MSLLNLWDPICFHPDHCELLSLLGKENDTPVQEQQTPVSCVVNDILYSHFWIVDNPLKSDDC